MQKYSRFDLNTDDQFCLSYKLLNHLFYKKSVFLLMETHHSQTRRLLSSEVLTNLLFSSTKTMVLTAPKCRSYSCTISPLRMSHCKSDKHKGKGSYRADPHILGRGQGEGPIMLLWMPMLFTKHTAPAVPQCSLLHPPTQ